MESRGGRLVTPKRPDTVVKTIEFVKGPDRTAPIVMAAITPKSVTSGAELMNRVDQPASQLPRAFDRKNAPSNRLTSRTGATFVTNDKPTGLKHSSPNSWMR